MDSKGRCSWCMEGTYQDKAGEYSCKTCRRGMISKEVAATSPTSCRNCPTGTYAVSLSECWQCPPNTISPAGAVGVYECTPIAGYYAPAGTFGIECPANSYCVQGTSKPTPCPPGTISNPGSSQCSPGVQAVLLYDWIFGVAWIILFMSGALAMGAYKTAAECWHHLDKKNISDTGVIRIQIVRDTPSENKGGG